MSRRKERLERIMRVAVEAMDGDAVDRDLARVLFAAALMAAHAPEDLHRLAETLHPSDGGRA